MLQGDPDVILTQVLDGGIPIMVERLRDLGFDGPVVIFHGGGSDANLLRLQDPDVYVQREFASFDDDMTDRPGLARYVEIIERGGLEGASRDFVQHALGGLGSLIVFGALRECGPDCNTPEQLNAALDTLTLDTDGLTFGEINFSPTDRQGVSESVFYHWQDGRIVARARRRRVHRQPTHDAVTDVGSGTASQGALAGRVALVTGSASGIGRAVTERYLADGASVVAIDVAETVIDTDGARFLSVVGDVRDPEILRRATSMAERQFGPVDTLAAVAGISRLVPFDTMSDEDRDAVLGVNFLGVWNAAQAVLPSMRRSQSRARRMIFCGSVESVLGTAQLTAYVASKHAVVGLAKALSLELAVEGITVNVVSPAGVATPMLRTAMPEMVEEVRVTTPLLRLAEPEEIAAFFAFIASRRRAT
jgi:NAD(P)-dependent dehydrogenase (short-subunit alcohol dehydrogenase family)